MKVYLVAIFLFKDYMFRLPLSGHLNVCNENIYLFLEFIAHLDGTIITAQEGIEV